ncbi:MAG TPA: ABC transporter permease [Candidatus Azoamicus sp. MARI]
MKIINIYKIAKKEIVFNFYNYWFLLSAIIFCSTNFTIIYFGESISGDYSQTDIRSLSLSVIHLQMYLIPLLSFILSYDSILSERESGTLDLILSYRITLFDVLTGKLLGNSLIFMFSFLIGFLPVSIYLYTLGLDINILIKFILISIWLSIIFNAFAIYISNSSTDRTFVILVSIFIWLFFIFIYDILFTFIAIFFYGIVSNNFLNIILLFNPVEIFRLISIFEFIPLDANDLFGINIGNLKIIYIIFAMLFWLIISIFIFLIIDIKKK